MAKGDKIRIVYQTLDGRQDVLEVEAEKNGASLEANVVTENKEQWVKVEHLAKSGKVISDSKVKLSAVVAVVDLPSKPRE